MARRASDLNWGIQREKRNADSAGNDTAAARTGTWVEFQEFDFMGYSDRLLGLAVCRRPAPADAPIRKLPGF